MTVNSDDTCVQDHREEEQKQQDLYVRSMCSNDKMHERYVGIFSHTPPCIEEQHNSVANSSEREAMASMQAASLVALSYFAFKVLILRFFPTLARNIRSSLLPI